VQSGWRVGAEREAVVRGFVAESVGYVEQERGSSIPEGAIWVGKAGGEVVSAHSRGYVSKRGVGERDDVGIAEFGGVGAVKQEDGPKAPGNSHPVVVHVPSDGTGRSICWGPAGERRGAKY